MHGSIGGPAVVEKVMAAGFWRLVAVAMLGLGLVIGAVAMIAALVL